MNKKTAARDALEDAVRTLVPRREDASPSLRRTSATSALAGVGGMLAGYTLGRFRRRRKRQNRGRAA